MEEKILNVNNEGLPLMGSGNGGEYTELPAEYREQLSAPLPAEAIKPHPTRPYLSTIKSAYIIERINDVFGIGGWDFEHEIIGSVKSGERPYIICKGRIYIKKFDIYSPIQYGGHIANSEEIVDAYKSAITDALTKCSSYLEIGIQVFKGKPGDTTSNIGEHNSSKDEDKVEESELEEDKTEDDTEDDTEDEATKEETTEEDTATDEEEDDEKDELPNEEATSDENFKALFPDAPKDYDKIISEYDDAEKLSNEAVSIINAAKKDGYLPDDIEALKKRINKKYLQLIK